MQKIAGCDFHPRRQQIAIFNAETGNISEHRLANSDAFTSCFRGTLTCISLIGMGWSKLHRFTVSQIWHLLRVFVEVLFATG